MNREDRFKTVILGYRSSESEVLYCSQDYICPFWDFLRRAHLSARKICFGMVL